VQEKQKSPAFVIARDQHILHREIAKWTSSKEFAVKQISQLRGGFEMPKRVGPI